MTTTTDKPKLSPCPFCGGPDDILKIVDLKLSVPTFAVGCDNCGARGPEGESYQRAAEQWNDAGERQWTAFGPLDRAIIERSRKASQALSIVSLSRQGLDNRPPGGDCSEFSYALEAAVEILDGLSDGLCSTDIRNDAARIDAEMQSERESSEAQS